LASTAWTLGLEARAQVDQLASVADELTELSQRRQRHPALGQASHAKQVDEVGGIPLVVLHPAVPPIVAEEVGEVHVATARLDHVGRQYHP